MIPSFSKKRSMSSHTDFDDLEIPSKRRRSRSISSCPSTPEQDFSFSPPPRPPPLAYDLDRLNYHIDLQSFGSSLQKAANAIFPGDQLSRYSKVDVILLSWEEEDPNLPVSIEIQELKGVFKELYGYEVEEWLIPGEDCHNRLQARILEFLGDSDPRRLKIVYYAGHGKLTNHGQPAWTSRRNSRKDRCPTIKWSGIQNTLEESRSDVLILLDCCSSGVCTTDEGNGITELIAACAYNAIANGVGPFSFTHALNTKLRQMAQLPYFTVGQLYNAIFTEIQGLKLEDEKHRKAPVHLVLSQNAEWPRSIRLANYSKGKAPATSIRSPASLPSGGASFSQPLEIPSGSEAPQSSSQPQDSTRPFRRGRSPSSSGTSMSQLLEYPRLLFSIRLSEDVKPNELSEEFFTDWLRSVPVSAGLIRVEAGFASDSTLLLLSMPPSMLAYLQLDPAITLLGTVRSKNMMVQPLRKEPRTAEEATLGSRTRSIEETDSKELRATYFNDTDDAQTHSRKLTDDLGLNNGSHFSTTVLEQPPQSSSTVRRQSPLSAYYSHAVRNSASPSNNTSGESISVYSESGIIDWGTSELSDHEVSEFSEIDDPFFGVDFTVGVDRIDSLPSAATASASYQPEPAENISASYHPTRDVHASLLSPLHNSGPSTPGVHADGEEVTSVYSLPVDDRKQVILVKMKPAHLSFNGPVFGGDIPEDIGYEIYKLGTLVQALKSQHREIDSGYEAG